MLSKNNKLSPARIATGLVGVGAISLAALGLTASGTQAAEHIVSKVEAATGVSLRQDMPAPPARLEAPEKPEKPERPEQPERPEKIEKRVYTNENNKDGKRITKFVFVHADGTRSETEMPDVNKILAEMPEIHNRKCGGKDGEPTVEHRADGGKKIMIICTDRIERLSADATRMAMGHKQFGMRSAMMGLRMARRSIEEDSSLKPEERAKALKGIDEAIAEVSKESSDKD